MKPHNLEAAERLAWVRGDRATLDLIALAESFADLTADEARQEASEEGFTHGHDEGHDEGIDYARNVAGYLAERHGVAVLDALATLQKMRDQIPRGLWPEFDGACLALDMVGEEVDDYEISFDKAEAAK